MVKKEVVKEPEVKEEKQRKYKVVNVSQYYNKAREVGAGNVRDIAIELLFDEYGDKVVYQIDDKKSGEMKFVVKL